MTAILVMGARRGQVPAITTAARMGLEVVTIDPDPRAPGMALAHARYVHDLADEQACLAVARAHRVAAVVTVGADYPMPVLARICEELRLPGTRPAQVVAATNKRVMRAALTAAGVPCPVSLHVRTEDEALDAHRGLPGDSVFKPAMSHGGRGVTRVAADAGPETVACAFRRARAQTRADAVLVEEFVDGPEFSVETLTAGTETRVVAVTDKVTSGAPYYVEVGHSQPSRVPPWDVERIVDCARQAVDSLGITDAAGHAELRLGPRGPSVMEVGARLGGGFIATHLTPLSTGVDLMRATIDVALGRAPDLRPGPRRASAIRFLTGPEGRIREIHGAARARSMPGVIEVDVYVSPRDVVGGLTDASGRLGHVICEAGDAATAMRLAETAVASIEVEMEAEDDRQALHAPAGAGPS